MTSGLFAISLLLAAGTAQAQAQHKDHGGAALETGQSQFAAIAEIVTMLRDDPEANWAAVDIDALRDHLVDMDTVTTGARVETGVQELTVTFTVSGDGPVAGAIGRMVLAHGPMLAQDTGWRVATEKRKDGAVMRVTPGTAEALETVTGLGFFGVMTIGAHHQEHHVMIATGHAPH